MERLFLECAVRAVLIAAATAVALRTLRVKTAAARHAAWTGVVALMLLLPAWTAWGPKATVRVLPPAPASIFVPVFIPVKDFPSAEVPTPVEMSEFAPRPAVWTWRTLVLWVYLLGAACFLIRLAIGTIRASRLTSDSCVAPVTVGLLKPRVILPECWRQWPQAQLDAVLTHEGAHVRRRDVLVQWLALLNRAVFWFHPLVWWLERRLSALAEEACDAAVLERGHDPHDYSKYLLDLARSVERAGMRLDMVGMAMPGSFLPQRIKNILEGVRAPRLSRARMACMAAALAISSTIFAASSLDRAVGAPPQAVPVPRVTPAASSSEAPRLLLAQAQTTPAMPAPVPRAPAPFSIAVDFDYTQLNRAEYSVHIAVRIPGSEPELARKAGAEQTTIRFEGLVKDDFGAAVTTVSDEVTINMSGATAAELAGRPIQYDTRVVLLPGKYTIKLLARDNETGRLGTFETPFVIPAEPPKTLLAQAQANPVPAPAPVTTTPKKAPLEFETASVRPAKPQGRGRGGNGPWGLKFDPGLLLATNITMKELFRQAYSLKEYQLTGPDWLNSTTYDVTAKPAAPSTPDEHRLMLRKLLADRFQLKFHSETKETEVMALRVAKNGPKFHQAEAGPPSDADSKVFTGPFGMSPLFQKLDMEHLATMLSGSCGTLELPFGIVVDMTGLKGDYDLRMKTVPNPDSGPRTIFDQACEALPQLGLEFKRQKVPVEMYVIDSAEKAPTEN